MLATTIAAGNARRMAKKRSRERSKLDSVAARARSTPIGDYGFLSDGEVSALVSPSGSIDWMCLPRFDSPSAFGHILGKLAGSFRVAPDEVTVPGDRRYLPGTLILETSWGTPTGWIIVRDALLMGPWRHEEDRSKTHRRTPNDYDAEHPLLRTIRCVSGEVQTVLDCEPVLDYGQTHVTWEYTEHGYHQGVATAEGSDLKLTLTTDLRLGFEGGRAGARGRPRRRPDAAQGRRRPLHRTELGLQAAPHELRRGVRAPGLDRASLAALAGPR